MHLSFKGLCVLRRRTTLLTELVHPERVLGDCRVDAEQHHQSRAEEQDDEQYKASGHCQWHHR
ncbi:MAG: hypothetical protein EPN99_09060 [Frankiales bacterium]|nr:MAG: hypothetical protein EPN99_09060 [Frankiales bacterium]